ncbi:MAG: PHP domain-containing protein [Methanomicrobiales archaeon]
MKYDLHVHSKYSSDGYVEPELMVKTAKKRGLDGIAVTDHDTIKGGLLAEKFQDTDFQVIVGCEVTSNQGEIIGLFLNQEIVSKNHLEVMDEIKEQGGLVIIPHPFDTLRRSTYQPRGEFMKNVDNIEVFNSRCIHQKYNLQAAAFAMDNKLGVSAGSDAHFVNEIGNAGIITEDDVMKSLKDNNLETFGKRSSIFNHCFTTMLKIWRKQLNNK